MDLNRQARCVRSDWSVWTLAWIPHTDLLEARFRTTHVDHYGHIKKWYRLSFCQLNCCIFDPSSLYTSCSAAAAWLVDEILFHMIWFYEICSHEHDIYAFLQTDSTRKILHVEGYRSSTMVRPITCAINRNIWFEWLIEWHSQQYSFNVIRYYVTSSNVTLHPLILVSYGFSVVWKSLRS